MAKVYRRDELPNLNYESAAEYQRPLIPEKLKIYAGKSSN
jgi:hypothetical protein